MTELLLLLAVLLVAAYGVVAHNRFVRQQHLVEEAWRQVEVELQRRQDLVPALVEAVQTFTVHDARGVQRALEQARRARGREQVQPAEAELAQELHRLPDGPHARLQAQLAETEDRIASARRLYNANVRALEVRLDSFPSGVVARLTGVERPEPLPELTTGDR